MANVCGNHFTESFLYDYAKKNNMCDADGGTSPQQILDIFNSVTGVPASVKNTKSVEELVPYIEKGQGVIIAVEPYKYNSPLYGEYDPNNPAGHALFLASVERDIKTNKITKYGVIDSNGRTPKGSVFWVDAGVLDDAYRTYGGSSSGVSIVTNNIIH